MPVKEADEKFYKNEVEEKKSLLPEEVKNLWMWIVFLFILISALN